MEDIAADRVVDDVGAPPAGGFPYGGDELLAVERPVVVCLFGTEFTAECGLLRTAGGHEDASPSQDAELDRGRPDATCAGMHEQRLAWL